MIRKAATGLAIASAAIALPLSFAHAAQTCSSSINDSTIKGEVSVQGSCTIQGSRIDGNVIIQPGSTLIIKDTTVLGPISGDKVKALDVQGSSLGKGILVTGSVDSVKLTHTSVYGAPVMLSGAKTVEIASSNVGDSMTLKDNSRVLNITYSTINNGLSCNRGIAYRAVGSNVNGQVSC
ncbi:hypothetical protein G7048_24830 [Diaphorobacter sp. HDW4B]|uniref:hypothetical protein n=1 Tax=Diaphorobacter sp. HDW4B TaxID=2714925 RepID=UPI00140ABBEC|nr:hypothetical protein [Diaphorobacter sp. HDW4B]QIL73287.1 hypothetical protein G7048_24830 [Diaphorobacter sp. HDW4B]